MKLMLRLRDRSGGYHWSLWLSWNRPGIWFWYLDIRSNWDPKMPEKNCWRPGRAVGRFTFFLCHSFNSTLHRLHHSFNITFQVTLCCWSCCLSFSLIHCINSTELRQPKHLRTAPRSGWLDVLIACLMLLVSAGLQITFSIILLSKAGPDSVADQLLAS